MLADEEANSTQFCISINVSFVVIDTGRVRKFPSSIKTAICENQKLHNPDATVPSKFAKQTPNDPKGEKLLRHRFWVCELPPLWSDFEAVGIYANAKVSIVLALGVAWSTRWAVSSAVPTGTRLDLPLHLL